jgi:hypothetical protein
MAGAFHVITQPVADRLRMLASVNGIERDAALALNLIAEETMTRSKELTPVDTGVLKRSGKVSVHAKPRSLRAELTYGTEYAVYVHEIPPPPAKSPKGRSARHGVGQWKFLETAVNATARTLAQRMAELLRMTLGRR